MYFLIFVVLSTDDVIRLVDSLIIDTYFWYQQLTKKVNDFFKNE